jgi:hypothetical protein
LACSKTQHRRYAAYAQEIGAFIEGRLWRRRRSFASPAACDAPHIAAHTPRSENRRGFFGHSIEILQNKSIKARITRARVGCGEASRGKAKDMARGGG